MKDYCHSCGITFAEIDYDKKEFYVGPYCASCCGRYYNGQSPYDIVITDDAKGRFIKLFLGDDKLFQSYFILAVKLHDICKGEFVRIAKNRTGYYLTSDMYLFSIYESHDFWRPEYKDLCSPEIRKRALMTFACCIRIPTTIRQKIVIACISERGIKQFNFSSY